MKWTFATCVFLSWAAVNLRGGGRWVCHELQVCEGMQLLSAFPQRDVVAVLAHCVLTTKKSTKVSLKSGSSACISRWAVYFSRPSWNFPHGDVRNVAKRTASRSGLWPSQDVIIRYQRHHRLFLTLSFRNYTIVTASKWCCMCLFVYNWSLVSYVSGGGLSSSSFQKHWIRMLLITGPVRAYSNSSVVESSHPWDAVSLRIFECGGMTRVTVLCDLADCKHTPGLIFWAS